LWYWTIGNHSWKAARTVGLFGGLCGFCVAFGFVEFIWLELGLLLFLMKRSGFFVPAGGFKGCGFGGLWDTIRLVI